MLNSRFQLVKYLPIMISYFKSLEFLPKLLLHTCENQTVASNVVEVLPNALCVLCSDYVRITTWCDTKKSIAIDYKCIRCNFVKNTGDDVIRKSILSSVDEENPLLISTNKSTVINVNILKNIFKTIWKFCKDTNTNILKKFLPVLPRISSHFDMFHTTEHTQTWISFAGHPDQGVRKEFSHVCCRIAKHCQNNEVISKTTKENILKLCLEELFKLAKKSLQYSDYDLQETLLETIDAITDIKVKPVPLECMKILLYFIMIPTSKYSAIAETFLMELARKYNTKPLLLYGKYRRETCQYIADLCAINQALIKYKLEKSLENVSVILGFSNAKDFACKESSYLMPYLVSLIVIMPAVLSLIKEVADLSDISQGELLANNYGGIFIYLFLNKSEKEFIDCMRYIENTTGMTASVLRKRNFKVSTYFQVSIV